MINSHDVIKNAKIITMIKTIMFKIKLVCINTITKIKKLIIKIKIRKKFIFQRDLNLQNLIKKEQLMLINK